MARKAETTEQTDQQKKNAAYGAAVARLKADHRDEYNALVAEEMLKVGIEWIPRPTEEEKAAAAVAEIYAKFPNLAPSA